MKKAIGLWRIFLGVGCLFCFALSVAAGQPEDRNNQVIVGGNANYPPYEFIDKNDQPAGFNIDLTRAVARVTGMHVQIRLGKYEEQIREFEAGTIDVMSGFSYSEERARFYDFSPPHNIVNFAIFGRKDSPPLKSLNDLRGKKILVLAGGRMQELLREKGFGENRVFVATYADGLRMLVSGEYDYMLMGTLPGTDLIKEYGLSNIVVIKDVEHQRYCFAVRKGNHELLARFSEGLAIVKKTGEYDKIYDKWLGILEPRGVPWTRVVKIGLIVIALFLGVLFMALLWSGTLKKQVEQRTAELALEVKERRRAEEDLRRNQERLIEAEKLAVVGTMVSGVAHEINNPNGLILLNLTMLKEIYEGASYIAEDWYNVKGDFDIGKWRYSELREKLGTIMNGSIKASRQIMQIVQDLKDYSRQSSAELKEDIDLNLVVRDAVRLIGNVIIKSTNAFVAHYAGDLPKIRGNAQRIGQVVVNLILNACQSLPDREKGIELITRYNANNRTVVLEIKDEGSGIAPENLKKITDPFYTTKREQGGTGLGLSVSSAIVKEHQGMLNFRSVVGKGTTVTVSFPEA